MRSNIEIGSVYEDPEGVWKITDISGNQVSIINIQKGNLQEGQECIVPLTEVEYFLN